LSQLQEHFRDLLPAPLLSSDARAGSGGQLLGRPVKVVDGSTVQLADNRKMRRLLWEDLLLNLARDLVRLRPNRLEPRAVKRRPKPYPLLNQPRRRFKETSHRNRYWKGRPRNYRSLN
jgi:hypothetical protein